MQLPHPLDRPYQREAYERIVNSEAKYIVCRMATGIGKTAVAANLACEGGLKTMACVMTKSLQWQYVDPYGFTELFGKANYLCGCSLSERGKPLQPPDDPFTFALTTDVCELEPEIRGEYCKPYCDYYLARESLVSSQAGIINYAKFLSDRPVVNSTRNINGRISTKGFDPDILVFDEAHELSDLVVNYSGLNYSWSYKRIMEYCQPIEIKLDDKLPLPIATMRTVDQGREWLGGLLHSLISNTPKKPKTPEEVRFMKWHKNTLDKVDLVLECLKNEPLCWYVRADKEGITIRPKTAKFHFRSLFEKAPKILMMSATIQPKDIEALGIDEFEFISMPNPFPAKDRPVYDLKAPPITNKSTLAERKQHAQIIANAINKTSDYWTTLTLFPSKKKAEDWGNWFTKMTRRPVFVPERGLPTDQAYQEWLDFKDNNDGAICSAWQFWTGVDGVYLNSVIIADMPYPNFGDPFEKARFDYSPSEARNRVANLVEQGNGRNRRGHLDHYGPEAQKFNAVAGGKKFDRLKSAMSRDFLDSIVINGANSWI